jgi:hypothetical protein
MPRFSNRPFIQQPPFPCNDPPLFVIPRATEFPASLLSPATTYVVLLKENHMQLTEAALSTGNPGRPRDLQCAIRVPGPYRPTTSTNHHQILMEVPTSPLSFRVSRRGPRNCRSLRCPRDDKKGRVVAQQGRLLNRRIFQT